MLEFLNAFMFSQICEKKSLLYSSRDVNLHVFNWKFLINLKCKAINFNKFYSLFFLGKLNATSREC